MTDFREFSPEKRRVLMTASAIGLVTAAILGAANVAQLGEPYWPAHRSWVTYRLQIVADETKNTLRDATKRQISIEIRIEDAERRRIKSKIDELTLELEKNPNAPESIRRLIIQQIDQQKEDYAAKVEIIKGLRLLQEK